MFTFHESLVFGQHTYSVTVSVLFTIIFRNIVSPALFKAFVSCNVMDFLSSLLNKSLHLHSAGNRTDTRKLSRRSAYRTLHRTNVPVCNRVLVCNSRPVCKRRPVCNSRLDFAVGQRSVVDASALMRRSALIQC